MQARLTALWSHLTALAQADGARLAFALLLLVLLPLCLRRKDRGRAWLSLVLLLLHLVGLGLAELFGEDPLFHDTLGHVALFFLLASIGRSLFLLITRSWMRPLLTSVPQITLDLVNALVYAIALLVTLRAAGVDPASLLAGSALVTAAVGLSLRDTLGNLFAGLALQAQHPFEVGDWIQFDPHNHHVGRVVEINWRATTVVTLDEVEIIVPNATLGQAAITNFSRPHRWSRRSLYVHAAIDAPPQRVQQVILAALAGSWGVRDNPPPSVITHAFDERGVLYWVRFFTSEFDRRDKVDSGARDRIWYALARHGLTIPGPRLDVRLRPETADPAAGTGDREQALRRVDLFRDLGDDVLAHLAALARSRLYAGGEVVLHGGDPGEEMFVVGRGEVAVLLDGEEGSSAVEVARLGPGGVFGEMALLTGEPRRATVRAESECELLAVGKDDFRRILDAHPDLAAHVGEVIAARQSDAASKVGERQKQRPAAEGTDLLTRILAFLAPR